MKFTKEQFSEALKAKLTPNGKSLAMSERTLNANAEKIYKRLEKASNDEELDDIVKEYLPDFEEINGNVQKDNSDFIKQWKEEHPDTKTEEANKQKPDGKPNGEGDDRLDKLLKEIEGLKAEREAEKTAKTISQKKADMISKFKEKGIKDEKWLDSYVKKISITAQTDIEAETKDAVDFYNLTHSETGALVPGNAGKGQKDTGHEWDDIKVLRKQNK